YRERYARPSSREGGLDRADRATPCILVRGPVLIAIRADLHDQPPAALQRFRDPGPGFLRRLRAGVRNPVERRRGRELEAVRGAEVALERVAMARDRKERENTAAVVVHHDDRRG